MRHFVGHFVLYLFIGGLFAGCADREYVDVCGAHMPTKALTVLAVGWPAVTGAALTSKSTEEPLEDHCPQQEGTS